MNNILDMLEYVLRVMAACVLALISMIFAAIVTLFGACGEGFAWLAGQLVNKYCDETEEIVNEEVTTEE